MRVAYRTLQVPRKWGLGAFMPGLTRGGAPVSNGQNIIDGAPGTVPIKSPRPEGMINYGTALWDQPSLVSPDVFYPALYTFRANPSVHFPGALFSDSVVPAPAVNLGRTPLQTQHRFRIGGRTATSALRPFVQWPTYNRVGARARA